MGATARASSRFNGSRRGVKLPSTHRDNALGEEPAVRLMLLLAINSQFRPCGQRNGSGQQFISVGMGRGDGAQLCLREGRKGDPHLIEALEDNTLSHCRGHGSNQPTENLGNSGSQRTHLHQRLMYVCTLSLRGPRAALCSSARRVLWSLSCFTASIS